MGDIDQIQHRKLLLTDDPRTEERPHRPELRIWAEDEGDEPGVVFSMGPLFGQPQRFVELLPAEARALAVLLKQVADDIDSVCENANERAYDRQQERLMETGGGTTLLDQQIEAMKFK